jgi:putative ABC transport system permease protein
VLKFLPLLWANLRRRPVRTTLTLASIIVAFLLFGLLETLQSALALGADLAGADRLVTMHKMSLIQTMPRSYLNRIAGTDGVVAATSFNWFGGWYQDERNQLAVQTTDPEAFLEVYREYAMPEEQRKAWFADRASMIVGKSVANQFGWHVGDTVPMHSSFYRKRDGSAVWDLKVAGIFDAANGDNSSIYFHYDYLNEAMADFDQIGWVVMRVADPSRMQDVARGIDTVFANSPAETKTGTERAFIQQYANAMGNIGAIVATVATAVFFTMLLVTGNTMAQSVRERTNEIAVLKTLGYQSSGISMLVLAEAFAVTAVGGIAGLAISASLAETMSAALAQYFPVIGLPTSAYVIGGVLIVTLSALAGLLPSLQAGRLRIVEALRKT